jgi:hypothetical protein
MNDSNQLNKFWMSYRYEKLCLRHLDYPITKASKQLIYNCIATIPWKYDKLINKMSCQKIKELYYSFKLVHYKIQCTHYICGCNQPCLTLLTSCILVACNNYITTKINLITNQWLLCNKCTTLNNTYNHATCIHFHYPIYMTFQLICN